MIKTGLGGGDCGYKFIENEEYLVYGYIRDGISRTNICTGTKLLTAAKEDLKFLGVGRSTDINPNNQPDIRVTIKKIMDIITFSLFGISLLIFFYGLIKRLIYRDKLIKFYFGKLGDIYTKVFQVQVRILIYNWLIFIGIFSFLIFLLLSKMNKFWTIISWLGFILFIFAFIMQIIWNKKLDIINKDSSELIIQKLEQLNMEDKNKKDNLYKRSHHYKKLAVGGLTGTIIFLFWYLITNFVVCC